MTGPWLAMVGIGEDGHLSPAAAALVAGAELVVGGRRHLALAASLIRGAALPWPSPLADAFPAILEHRFRPVAVLASGDPYCYGVGTLLAGLVPPGEMVCHPAPSAFALARGRLGWGLPDVAEASVCGRPIAGLVRLLQPGARLLVLSADSDSPAAIAALLVAQGFGASMVHVLEAMGGPAERHRRAVADGFDLAGVHALNTVAIECVGAGVPLAAGLPDALFEHDGQLTRREVRAVTLSSLAPRRGEMLWDVGAGAGSVGIEWMLSDPTLRAVAVEADPARCYRITHNAAARGTPGLAVVEGRAPGALAGLPAPHAVFLGGGAHRPGVIDAAWDALPGGGRLVANGVTLETEAALSVARGRFGGTLLRIGLERLDKVGAMHAYRPAMAVTQWVAVK